MPESWRHFVALKESLPDFAIGDTRAVKDLCCDRTVGRPTGVPTFGKEGKMGNRQSINAVASDQMTGGASWINVLLGIWVIISPFILQFARLPAVMWNNVVIGVVVALLALIRSSLPRQSGWSLANVILGIWMIISPFVLGVMTTTVLWNNIVLGIVIALVAVGNASMRASATI
jgi:hypothetical protein